MCMPPDVLPLSSLRLLLSPLQLMAAALWGVVQHRAVVHYGLLEDFITAVLDTAPELLSHSERFQLVFGLRAKVVLEMCRSDDLCYRQNIEPHLTRIDDLMKEQNEEEAFASKMKSSVDHFSKVINTLLDDPNKRDRFYQETLPSLFDPNFDSALCDIVRKCMINLEKLLPVPNLDQTPLWLGLSSPVLKECRDILNQPEPLSQLIQHHKQDYDSSPEQFVNDLGQHDCDAEAESKTTQLNSSYTVKDEESFVAEVTEDDFPSVEVTLDEGDTDLQVAFDEALRIKCETSDPSLQSTDDVSRSPSHDDLQDCNSSVTNADQTHSGRRKTFKCFVCGQTFCSLFELKRHIIPRCSAESVEKNVMGWGKNERLSMSFAISNDSSEGHMRKRSSRIKTCSVCGEAFTSSTDLTDHMRAHTEDASHIPDDCDKDFDNYENQKLHRENGSKTSGEHSRNVVYSQEIYSGQAVIKECVVVLRRISDDSALSPQICTISCKDCGQRVLKKNFRNHQRKCFQRNRKKETPLIKNYRNLIKIKPCMLNSLTTTNKRNIETYSESQPNQSPIGSQSTYSSFQSLWKCTLCDETFSKIPFMKRHYHNLHKVKGPYQCPVCKRPFMRLCELVKHHNNILLFQCNTCKWCFPMQSQLKKHKKQFNNTCATPHICEICGKSCLSASFLKFHKQCHTRPKETTVCSYCGKNFSSPHCLRVHMNRHTGGFACPLCPKVFFKNTYFKRHMNKHNGIAGRYLCEICGKDWPTEAYLKKHMVQHQQERPFKCDQCGVTYKKMRELKVHQASKHTEHKPYVCSVCGVGYRFSGVLKEHMMKHTGVWPYVCSRCGKGFARRYVFKAHQITQCGRTKL